MSWRYMYNLYNFCGKALQLQGKKLTRLDCELLSGKLFCFHELSYAGK